MLGPSRPTRPVPGETVSQRLHTIVTGLIALLAPLVGCAGGGLPDFDGDGSPDVSDCRPSDPDAFPGATDPVDDGIDQNCDGIDGLDGDADGYAATSSGGPDCNDADPSVNPGATEIPDNDVDEDCDDVVLRCDVDSDGAVAIVCGGADCDDFDSLCRTEADCADGDGDGVVLCAGDCDEGDDTVYPTANELCDGLDNDCDGELPANEADADGDGVTECAGDCDDALATAYPGGDEVCDGVDSDCDGAVPADESDGDGDGDPACSDCDDADPIRGSNLPEACDGIDNDCDGVVLPGGAFGEFDNDADGAAECAGDCNDFDATVGPGATDGCDGVDTDCNGVIDDINDADGDGWCAGDCDDTDPAIHPGQWDAPGDALDVDCDGTTDTGVGLGFATITGTEPGEQCGYRLAGGADWDADGVPDLVIACPAWTAGLGGTNRPGRVCLIPGGSVPTTGGIDLSAASWCVEGTPGANDYTGSTLATGDLDGDGLLDLAVSATGRYGGTVGVYYGTTLATASGAGVITDADVVLVASSGWQRFGRGLAFGDVDGDGLDDLLIGDEMGATDAGTSFGGRAGIFLGVDLAAATGPISASDAFVSWIGPAANSFLGYSVAAGDVDGDSLAEVLIGAPGLGPLGNGNEGAAMTWFGTQLGTAGAVALGTATLTVESGSGTLGRSTVVADVDGDGLGDLVVGAPTTGGAAGLVGMVVGATLQPGVFTADSQAVIYRGYSGQYAGARIDTADVDGDGARDLLVSGFHFVGCLPDQGSGEDGKAWVVTGGSVAAGESWLDGSATASFVPAAPDACLGAGFAPIGDLNGDGREDLVLGAPSYPASTEPGTVYILISPY